MGASARRIDESEQTRCPLEQEPGLPDLLLHPARGDGWIVDLLNDRGERKATGSYYTPDYLVKYIVEATVDPLLHKAVVGTKGDEKIDAVLALNVLDPSMGSGHFLVEVVERISRFLVELGMAPEELESGGELAYWKRRVAQSCVYGVDANPLAVDLAKLSLWLATVARDRPLSFLDHHPRCGNSLVGARITSLQPAGGKKRKKAEDETQLSMLGDDAGFDAVVGNPPYVRQESLGDLKPYLASSYPEVYHGVADLYVYFYQQGLRQLRRGGLMSSIVTNKWLRAGYGEPLREYFASEGVIEEIVDFGHAPIFEDADVFPCIVLLRKRRVRRREAWPEAPGLLRPRPRRLRR